MKYIFITGGVVSSLGKGLTSASIALLLESRGLRVAMLKLDPYLNVDPGTMSPFQHGEVYVTDDGAETDLDLGHYYRFTHALLSRYSNATSGQIYEAVIKAERRGDYLGKTVQVIPHVTDEIKRRILACAQQQTVEITLVEIGGTVGDIESQPFLEAIRQFRHERPSDCLNIHLTYIPYLHAAGELKTKPTQHSIQTLRGIGIIPDFILCRSENDLPEEIKDKISLFCSVPKESVIDIVDVSDSIYEVPIHIHRQELDQKLSAKLQLPIQKANLSSWTSMLEKKQHPKGSLTVGVVGKYVQHRDAYKSVYEALEHAAIAHQVTLNIRPFDSENIVDHHSVEEIIGGCDGYLVPGGFGERGWIGKILTAKYCREKQVPYFGLCLGMQVLCVEFARHVLHLPDANSTEMDPNTAHPIISLLSEQRGLKNLGGTMRLGAYTCDLEPDTLAAKAYGSIKISERHRHRYEFNNAYKELVQKKGLILSGWLRDGQLVEIVEIKDHPWMLGVQFHPEFTSKPTHPHPLFKEFVGAMLTKNISYAHSRT